ncbi:MAG: DNA translocase FtsK, partial [Eubacterium sp.]|nr:DNA translocase FtsK [Eubacterium sp.]
MAGKVKNPKPIKKEETAKRMARALESEKRRRQIWSVILFALGLLASLFSVIGKTHSDIPNLADQIHGFLAGMFGVAMFFTGPFIIYIAVIIASNKDNSPVMGKLVQLIAILLLFSAAVQIIFFGKPTGSEGEVNGFFETIGIAFSDGMEIKGGGIIGLVLGLPLLLFGRVAASIIIALIIFVTIMITANISLIDFLKALAYPFKKVGAVAEKKVRDRIEDQKIIKEIQRETSVKYNDGDVLEEINRAKRFSSIEAAANSVHKLTSGDENKYPESNAEALEQLPLTAGMDDFDSGDGAFYPDLPFLGSGDEAEEEIEEKPQKKNPLFEAIESYNAEYGEEQQKDNDTPLKINESMRHEISDFENDDGEIKRLAERYTLPPVVLLNDIVSEKSAEDIEAELQGNAETLIETLKSFGVLTKIVGICRGPSVTRYEIQPAAGVKISKITGLVDDIALNLATAGVRIEAPIPNKAAVGIEVPNKKVDMVALRSLIDSEEFRNTGSKLGAVIGKNISGEIIIADIAKMPHILIAGTTGSGKSVCVNSIIMSILYRSTPDEVRLLMI